MIRGRSALRPGFVVGVFVALVAFAPVRASEIDIPGWRYPPRDCPTWLVGDAPFDVEAFYKAPTEADNAAPLYREALEELERQLDADRSKRSYEFVGQLEGGDASKIDREAIDAMLSEYDEALRKLAAAQERPECVFEGDAYKVADHSRGVSRVIWVRAFRDVEKGDLERPIRDLALCLRLSRDLRPRGRFYSQLVSAVLDNYACKGVGGAMLGSPLLEVGHCDRLLAVLRDHESKGLDRFATGAKAEYIVQRTELRAFQEGRLTREDADGRAKEVELSPDDLAERFLRLTDEEAWFEPVAKIRGNADWMTRAAAAIRDHGPLWERERFALDDYYRAVETTQEAACPERLRALKAASAKHLGDEANPSPLWLARGMFTSMVPVKDETYPAIARAIASRGAQPRAYAGLIALRRWRLAHPEADELPSLEEACREAGLPGAPIDPFSGEALKMTTIDGRVAVYSIGPDGVDDQGRQTANNINDWEGDFVFSMPEMAGAPPPLEK